MKQTTKDDCLLPVISENTEAATGNSPISRAKFRSHVLEQRSNQWLGKSSLALPISFTIFSASALGLVGLIISFLIFGSYTRTESVSAVIAPQNGIVKVIATTSGEVTDVYVHEGDRVIKNAPLFRVRKSLNLTNTVPTNQAKSTIDSLLFEVIKSPASGRIYALPTKIKDQISSYQSEPIATVALADRLAVEAAVTSAVQAKVKKGSPVQLEIDAFKGRPQGRLNAEVIAVAAAPTDEFDLMTGGNKRSYKVFIRINTAGLAYPHDELLGKTVKVKFLLEKRKLYQWLLDPLQTLFSN